MHVFIKKNSKILFQIGVYLYNVKKYLDYKLKYFV